MVTEKFIIKNDFCTSGEVISIVNPYTNETVKKVYKSSVNDINSSLDYLTEIFPEYRKLPVYAKSEFLEKITNKFIQRKDFLANLLTLETGKPIRLSGIEVDRAIFTFRTGAEEARRIDGEIISLDQLKGSEKKKGLIKRFPLGVILAITPWNFPINLVAHKLSPALASGNVVLLKPASASLTCGTEIVKIVKESADEMGFGFTPVNVVTNSGSEIERFVSDDRVKMVSFTGSPAVGWDLKKKLYKQRVSLELGGNAGVIVDETADIKLSASKIAAGAFAHAGQSCISVQRVFVHKSVFNEFKKQLLEETGKIKYGNPFDEDVITGPMINEKEAERVQKWADEAVSAGAEILAGGKREGAVYQPTILLNAPQKCDVNSKEVFAPVLTLSEFGDFKKAVEEINNSDFGLQAGVFTNNFSNISFAFDNIETGGVVINDVSTYRMDSMPYGGVKNSGTGKEGIKYAAEEMTERKILILEI
jgi:glyceraldehyde-3-phosphate dehydrogenase (NADP+)